MFLSPLAQRLCGRRRSRRSARAGQRTLLSLASVELQCVLQWLSARDVCVASATCRRLQKEAAQPLVWSRFADGTEDPLHRTALPEPLAEAPPSLLQRLRARLVGPAAARVGSPSSWQSSASCRVHLPCTYVAGWTALPSEDVLLDVARYGHVKALANARGECIGEQREDDDGDGPPARRRARLTFLPDWSRAQLAQMLALPGLQRLEALALYGAWLKPGIFRTVCRLPRLKKLFIDYSRENDAVRAAADDSDDAVLDPASFSCAHSLRHVQLIDPYHRAPCFRGLASILRLESLSLHVGYRTHGLERVDAPIIADLPRWPAIFGFTHLTQLHLSLPYGPLRVDEYRALLSGAPHLRCFADEWASSHNFFTALLALGPSVLPSFEHLTFLEADNQEVGIAIDLMRQFMRDFGPRARVCWAGGMLGDCDSALVECCTHADDKCRYSMTDENNVVIRP